MIVGWLGQTKAQKFFFLLLHDNKGRRLGEFVFWTSAQQVASGKLLRSGGALNSTRLWWHDGTVVNKSFNEHYYHAAPLEKTCPPGNMVCYQSRIKSKISQSRAKQQKKNDNIHPCCFNVPSTHTTNNVSLPFFLIQKGGYSHLLVWRLGLGLDSWETHQRVCN